MTWPGRCSENGHDVRFLGVQEQLAPLQDRLADFGPKVVFNGCEGLPRARRHEYAVAGVLEMHGYRYTGSSPTALLVARKQVPHQEDPGLPRDSRTGVRRVSPPARSPYVRRSCATR